MLNPALFRLVCSLTAAILAAMAFLVLLDVPRAAADPLAATTRIYPSALCNTTLQACIDGSVDGDSIVITAGTYITSITLNKAVSLLGAGAPTTTLRALNSQRAITVTGAGITRSTFISGMQIVNGFATGNGGGVHVLGAAQPLLANLVISGGVASGNGGGIGAEAGSPLTLLNVQLQNNLATQSGGGLWSGGSD